MPRRIQSSRARAAEVLNDPALSTIPETNGEASRTTRQRTAWSLIVAFWKLLAGQRGFIFSAMGLGTISTLLALIPPAATKVIIDSVLGSASLPPPLVAVGLGSTERKHLLVILLVGVFCVSMLTVFIQLWGRWIATRATKRLQLSVRRRAFEHAVRLPLHRVQALKSGGASSLLREDAGSIGELIFGLIYNPWRASVQLLGSLLILAWVDWKLLLGGAVLLPVVYWTHRTWISRIRPMYRAARKSRQSLDAQTTETFGGMRVVRAFGRQRSEATRFIRSNNLLIRQELRVWWSSRWVEILWSLMIPAASASLLWYGGRQVMQGELSLGDLMMFLVYLLMLLEPLAILAESAAGLQNSLAALDRVLDLLGEPRELARSEPGRAVDRPRVQGELKLEQVSFAYPGTTSDVLDEISLHILPGQTVALIGSSGAGKTTLCHLIARFYDPTAGRLLLDGVDLRDYDVESYRGLLGIVEQDVFLFDGTIAENIAFGRPEATDEQIEAAAAQANATEFIERFPQGFQTRIGERGVKLSGGQRQRLAIARAILADPKILILDEATSNLDSESELLIQQSLSRLMTGRTSFVIAHRLSTIRHADLIVVMQHGRIVEIGTHAELSAHGVIYRRMLDLQVSGLTEPLSA